MAGDDGQGYNRLMGLSNLFHVMANFWTIRPSNIAPLLSKRCLSASIWRESRSMGHCISTQYNAP